LWTYSSPTTQRESDLGPSQLDLALASVLHGEVKEAEVARALASTPRAVAEDHQDSAVRRPWDAAFMALAYSCGPRRSEAVAVDLADLDSVSHGIRVRRGNGTAARALGPDFSSGLRVSEG
jgi:site-specific recombinase XerD